MSQPVSRQRLDRRSWAVAALEALGESGLAGVAVEPIARRVGATKGSFYWHFPDRRALLVAALELYEREGTEDLIDRVRQESGATDQLRTLLRTVFLRVGMDPVYHALLADASDPDVAPVLARVTQRRIAFLVESLEGMGFTPAQARQRGILAYTSWLGLMEAERAVNGSLFDTAQGRRAYVTFLERLLEISTGSTLATP